MTFYINDMVPTDGTYCKCMSVEQLPENTATGGYETSNRNNVLRRRIKQDFILVQVSSSGLDTM